MAVTRICFKYIGVLQPLVAQDLRLISSLRPHFISLINSNYKQHVSTSAAMCISSTNTSQENNKDDTGLYNTSDINANNSLYWRNTFITGARAMEEYLLELEDLEGLPTRTFRNAHDSTKNLRTGTSNWYLKSDIERRALEVWGSWQVLTKELDHRRKIAREEEKRREGLSALIAMLKKTQKDISRKTVEAEAFGGREQRVTLLQGSARVVLYAILSNTAVMIFKLIAYIYTGSAAMLSEAIHSLADVLNQCLLGFGIARSIRKPDLSHPYGFSRVRYVYALISGVGIFFLGAGVTVYHGITGLLHPPTLAFLPAAFAVLAGSLLVEGATLATAIREVQRSAKDSKMTFKDYVLRGRDPTAVAVLMEDSAAVSGVFLAASCLGLAYYTGNPVYDAIGSICIGGLLGMVALFLIQRNSSALVGRSIPPERLKQITDLLEGDQIVRSIHDVKATDLGADSVRFKAEINFDGREVARLHINRLDLEKLLKEVQSITSVTELEKLLLEHGEQVIDMLGSEVDRIEMKIKKDNPEVRHVDLEIL